MEKNNEKFRLRNRMNSFSYAFNGLKILFKEEHNARIHLIAAIGVIVAGCFFDISFYEWLVILFCVSAIFILELINSAIENLANAVTLEYHPLIKKTKDLAAAAVLVASVFSMVCAILIFLPKIMVLCGY